MFYHFVFLCVCTYVCVNFFDECFVFVCHFQCDFVCCYMSLRRASVNS